MISSITHSFCHVFGRNLIFPIYIILPFLNTTFFFLRGGGVSVKLSLLSGVKGVFIEIILPFLNTTFVLISQGWRCFS